MNNVELHFGLSEYEPVVSINNITQKYIHTFEYKQFLQDSYQQPYKIFRQQLKEQHQKIIDIIIKNSKKIMIHRKTSPGFIYDNFDHIRFLGELCKQARSKKVLFSFIRTPLVKDEITHVS